MKFQCQKCGECCKNYERIEGGGVHLFEWEKNKLEQHAKTLGINLELQPFSIFKVGKVYVAYHYIIKNACPFFEDNSCMIYNNRPSTCKTFPINFFMYDPIENIFRFEFVPGCTAFDKSLKKELLEKQDDAKEHLKILRDYFGKEIVLSAYQNQHTINKFGYILKFKLNAGELIQYSNIPKEEREKLTIYPLFTFCKKNNILSRTQIKSIIEEHNNLEDVKDFSKTLDLLDVDLNEFMH
mgnify:CR=1 FL=1